MAGNYTLTIIKPDAFGTGKAGKIIAHLEQQGFKVLAARVMHLSQAQAGEFYAVHKERPFYGSLVSFMTSGLISGLPTLFAATSVAAPPMTPPLAIVMSRTP